MEQNDRKIKILVADKQQVFRKGLELMLGQAGDISLCDSVSSERELLNAITELYPDVLILDINMLDTNIHLAATVKQHLPSIAIIIVTPQPNDEEMFLAIKSRAASYLDRSTSAEELLATIRRVSSGEYPLNDSFLNHPDVAKKVLQQFQDIYWGKGAEVLVSPLTPREFEILNFMAKGDTNKQIAEKLTVSEHTIKNHITSILRKLDVNARTEAVIAAIKRGIISFQ
ncbi:MAG: response regulator transcription factor [Dehalococcoidia bacterium]|nr:response regulator transcription factor [Dehalococcoidia bacterium]MDD5495089.1 response regulator transcription factor [Dehalococcoidia bacterium]